MAGLKIGAQQTRQSVGSFARQNTQTKAAIKNCQHHSQFKCFACLNSMQKTISIVVSVDISNFSASQLVEIMQSSRAATDRDAPLANFSRPVPLDVLLGGLDRETKSAEAEKVRHRCSKQADVAVKARATCFGKSSGAGSVHRTHAASNSDRGPRGLTCDQLRVLLPPLAKGEPTVRVAAPSISNGLFVPSNSLRVPVGPKVAPTRSHIKPPVIAAPTAADASASNELATELHAHRQELLVSDHAKQPTPRTLAATCDESQSMHREPLVALHDSSSSLSQSVFDRSTSTEEVPERMAPTSLLAYRFVNALRRISLPREFASKGASKPQLANGSTRPSLCLTYRTCEACAIANTY
jgi:hypothetical protein